MAVTITAATSAEVVGSIDELLIQILVQLPVKSLMRFKLVSKHWKSLITGRQFSRLRYTSPSPAVGLFCPAQKISVFKYIHLGAINQTKPMFRELRFPDDPFSFWIHQSCNGLLLCCSSGNLVRTRTRSPIRRCYVYNPTTDCYTKLPRPGVLNEVPRIVHGVNLAFDHVMSPSHKVVCVRGSEFARELYQVEVYSSESGAWRVSGEPFSSNANFEYGVYWNGSVHWISYTRKELLYFNLDKERFGKTSLPDVRDGHGGRIVDYFGESCDHLHIIKSHDYEVAFDVYEMKRDYSEWFVKYRVDLTVVAAAFPEMAYMNTLINRTCYAFSVFSLVRAGEKCSFLVLLTPRKVVRFNLDSHAIEEICDSGDTWFECLLPHTFEYIESFACV
ncbi:F-box protein [Sesamum alatum]|uniref:F-box protein n=1 Tax=Sesamum alatum TaxID=300844 RepID=A0AAE2CRB7_9LAMI|nr:F-box protein [Sesamum alatum]